MGAGGRSFAFEEEIISIIRIVDFQKSLSILAESRSQSGGSSAGGGSTVTSHRSVTSGHSSIEPTRLKVFNSTNTMEMILMKAFTPRAPRPSTRRMLTALAFPPLPASGRGRPAHQDITTLPICSQGRKKVRPGFIPLWWLIYHD